MTQSPFSVEKSLVFTLLLASLTIAVPLGGIMTKEEEALLPLHFRDWSAPPPRVVDWRPFVSPVKNQVAALESYIAIETKNTWRPDLSENFMMHTLAKLSGTGACEGRLINDGTKNFVASNMSLEHEDRYGYLTDGSQITPEFARTPKPFAVSFVRQQYVDKIDPDSLRKYVARRPVIASLRSGPELHGYTGGIFRCPSEDVPNNHAILLVGYNMDEGYWIFKNSWGPHWGEGGYGRVYMPTDGSGSHIDMCGIGWEVALAESDFAFDSSTMLFDYKILYDTEKHGNDIGTHIDGKTPVECAGICDKTPDCKSFLYSRSSGRCWLKSAESLATPGQPMPNMFLFEKLDKPLTN